MKTKIISSDNGRSFNKSGCAYPGINGTQFKTNVFQSVMAPAESGFNLTVKIDPTDIWIEYQRGGEFGRGEYLPEHYLANGLAIRQKPKSLINDRNSDKTNKQNIIQTLIACSFYAKTGDNVILLTNIPAGDYSAQQGKLGAALRGVHKIVHKAGDMKGVATEFNIEKCYEFPECETAYYGAAYDLDLNLVNPDIWNYPTLILDIGDETTNYVAMNPQGDPVDGESGTIPHGMSEVYSDVCAWATKKGADISISELTRMIIFGGTLFAGKEQLNYRTEYLRRLSEFDYTIYSKLNSLVSLKRYRTLLPVGGSLPHTGDMIKKRYHFMNIPEKTAGAQMLNCYGQYIAYMLAQE
jgi:hypothetical protein